MDFPVIKVIPFTLISSSRGNRGFFSVIYVANVLLQLSSFQTAESVVEASLSNKLTNFHIMWSHSGCGPWAVSCGIKVQAWKHDEDNMITILNQMSKSGQSIRIVIWEPATKLVRQWSWKGEMLRRIYGLSWKPHPAQWDNLEDKLWRYWWNCTLMILITRGGQS